LRPEGIDQLRFAYLIHASIADSDASRTVIPT
jgi:hypothetical protein